MFQWCLVAHLVVLGNEGLLVLVVLGSIFGLETGLRESLCRGVVYTYATRTAAAGIDDCGRVELGEVVLLCVRDASKSNIISPRYPSTR